MTEQGLRDRFLYRCQCAIGVHEIPNGSNRGPQVDFYQLHYGAKYLGSYWCAEFLGYELDHAAEDIGAPKPFHIDPSCGQIRHDAQSKGRIVLSKDIKPADLVLFGAPPHHVGVVTGILQGVIDTIEGNTTPTPGIQPNGGGVYPKHHLITADMLFVNVCAPIPT